MPPFRLSRIPIVLVLSLSVLAGCKHAEKKNLPVVKDLKISGAKQVGEGDLKKKILTSETGWWPFARDQYFDQDVWRTDLKRIERYYRERGYYQAQVVDDRVQRKGEKEVALAVEVKEGEPTIVSDHTVAGLEPLPPEHRDEVLGQVRLQKGDVFIEGEWEGLKQRLAGSLSNLGYVDAKVEGTAYVDVATQQAKVDVRVEPGSRYRFGEVELVTGPNPRVEGWRILEQARAEVKTGEWYSDTAVDEAQARVFAMGVFGAVKVRRGEPDPTSGTVPIIVDVREAPFHAIRAGVGLAVDQARNEGRVLGEYTHRDFLGGLRRLNVRGNAGWAFLPTAYASVTGAEGAKSGPIANIRTDLDQPRLFLRDLSLQSRVELERGIEPAYSFFGARGRLGVSYEPLRKLTLTLAYNFEAYRLEEGQAGLGGTAPALLFGCPRACFLSYLEQRVEWDRRDDAQEPKHGFYLALGLQEGGGPLGGSFTYFRLLPEARYYVSTLGDKLTFAGRLRMGSLHQLSANPLDSPIVARFYGGGGNSMRGFSARRMSPQFIVEKVPAPDTGFTGFAVPIGGNGLFEGTVEARYNVWGQLVVATFLDTGFVTSEALDPRTIGGNMLYAVGAGLRYRTPVGPIRLDFAYRLPIGPPLQVYRPEGLDPTYQSEGSCFGIGGQPNLTGAGAPEGPCTLHVSIGEAF
ncbi:MAG TPA: BamA/TamA family outer membrane protein [Myxococcaceae bacterium]|nr:BamA/TamA family outer membrane protein [Myxococcaceae bacterium]